MSDRISTIFTLLERHIPDAQIELEYDDSPYALLVAIVLSAQSTDVQVNRVTEALFRAAPTARDMVELGYDRLCEYINSVGLYKTKAKNIVALSKILVEQYDGEVPATKEELMALPGVGLKSANLVLNVLHGEPTMPVDTHIFRVATRLGLSHMNTRDRMSADLETTLPNHLTQDIMRLAHHLLVLHGRYTCTARKPKCHSCPIAQLCSSKDKLIKSEGS